MKKSVTPAAMLMPSCKTAAAILGPEVNSSATSRDASVHGRALTVSANVGLMRGFMTNDVHGC